MTFYVKKAYSNHYLGYILLKKNTTTTWISCFNEISKASLSCLALNKCGLLNIVLAVGVRKVENQWSSLLYVFTW